MLVDDEAVHFALFREILAGLGIDLTEVRYHADYLGYDDRGCFEAALAEAGRPADRATVDALIAAKAARYVEEAEAGLTIFPGAAGTLAGLADAGPVAICSGALLDEIEFALGRMGIRDRVAAIVSAEDTTRCKPDPEGYAIALRALRGLPGLADLDAADCLVIEDSLAGVAAAVAAGMTPIAVAHTYRDDELRAAGAIAVVAAVGSITPAMVETIAPAPARPPR